MPKGEGGKQLMPNPPFGFVKDAEEAAQTVRYIFKLCYDDGFGSKQIVKKLKEKKVLASTV